MHTLSPNTLIDANELNDNFEGLASGEFDEDNNSLALFRNEAFNDFVVSGLIITGDSYAVNRNGSITSGVVCIDGVRITVNAVTAYTFAASNDTYIDVDSTGTVHYTGVTNNAASPALSAGYIRIGVVVTGATTIAAATSINQGQPDRTVPTTCNLYQSGVDSLGNKIYPSSPNEVITFTHRVQLQGGGDHISITLPLLAKSKLIVEGHTSTECVNTPSCTLYDRLIVDGTTVEDVRIDTDATAKVWLSFHHAYQSVVASGSRIVKLQLAISGGGFFQYTQSTLKVQVSRSI